MKIRLYTDISSSSCILDGNIYKITHKDDITQFFSNTKLERVYHLDNRLNRLYITDKKFPDIDINEYDDIISYEIMD